MTYTSEKTKKKLFKEKLHLYNRIQPLTFEKVKIKPFTDSKPMKYIGVKGIFFHRIFQNLGRSNFLH